MEGHLLFDKAVTKWKKKKKPKPTRTPKTLWWAEQITDMWNRDPAQASAIVKDMFIKWKPLKSLCLKCILQNFYSEYITFK